jgi:hypothetical protein
MKIRFLVMGLLLVGAVSGLVAMEETKSGEAAAVPRSIRVLAMLDSPVGLIERLGGVEVSQEELLGALENASPRCLVILLDALGGIPVGYKFRKVYSHRPGGYWAEERDILVVLAKAICSWRLDEKGELWKFEGEIKKGRVYPFMRPEPITAEVLKRVQGIAKAAMLRLIASRRFNGPEFSVYERKLIEQRSRE